MRHLAIAGLTLTLVAGVQASDDESTVRNFDTGQTLTVMPGSVRTYQTKTGQQWDALIELRDPKGAYIQRNRIGVTGCPRVEPVKLVGEVQGSGAFMPGAAINEWHEDGSRVFDTLAMTICIEAKKSAKAAAERTHPAGSGDSYVIVSGSARAYSGGGRPRSDAIVEFHGPQGEVKATMPVGVTGCRAGDTVRTISTVNADGSLSRGAAFKAWSREGDRVSDAMAMRICVEARRE